MAKKPAKGADSDAPQKEETLLRNAFERDIGISSLTLKKIFDRTGDPSLETVAENNKKWMWAPAVYDMRYTDKQGNLIKRMRSLLKDTYARNFAEYATWLAADTAWTSTAASTTPTLLNKLLSGSLKDEDLLESMKQFGIPDQEVFEPAPANTKNPAQGKRVRKQESFYKVQLPIAKAITMARISRLYVERDRDPFFLYEPSEWTEENQLQCEVLTNTVAKITNQYGLKNRVRQALIQSGKYNQQLVIFREAWDFQEARKGKGEKKTIREGLRLQLPPPTRCGWDLLYPVSSFNTDTGCEWAMHWKTMRWHDIQSSPDYWNKDRVSYGTCWFTPALSGNYFNEMYPHTARPPEDLMSTWSTNSLGQDREQRVMMYAGDQTDMPVFLTEMCIKLVPKDWELGDYDCPLWFRFVIAGDQSVIYAEPLPDCPVMFLGLDADESLASNVSLLLEALPHQDFINNLLTQHRLTVNQNLTKIIFYDKFGGGVDDKGVSMEELIKKAKAEGTDVNKALFVPFDSRRLRGAGMDIANLFKPITFGYQDTTAIITAINIYLGLMERVLGLSANEMGSTAPRITTAAETANVANVGNMRTTFTNSYVDDFMDTLGRRIVRYWQAFGDKKFTSFITEPTEDAVKQLKDMKFEVGDITRMKNGSTRCKVSGTRDQIDVDEFVASRSLANRIPSDRVASIMMQLLTTAIPFIADGTPEARQQIIDGLNRISHMLGAPKDYHFFAPQKPKDKDAKPEANYKKLIESMSFKDMPPDSKQYMLEQAGIPPSKFIEAQIKQAMQPQPQQGQPGAQGGQPPMDQVAAQIEQMTLQKVDQQLAPVIGQIKQQFQQVMAMISQGKQADQQFGQHITQLEQAVQQIVGVLQQQPPAPQPAPQPMPPQ